MAELAYLKQTTSSVAERVMVFTNPEFGELIRRRANRVGMGNVRIIICALTPNMDSLLSEILNEASYEQHAAE